MSTVVNYWKHKPLPSHDSIQSLTQSINVNHYLSSVLNQRGICHFEDAKKFFRPSLDNLHNPFLMKNMDCAVKRLVLSLEKEEKILIYGDYDVDGVTSTALAYNYLTHFTCCSFYIPDREKEGYGISKNGIDWASQNNISLIIALDLGITSIKEVAYASQLGIDMIICDHHMPGATIPEAIAVLNPKQQDCSYPYKELSGCGLGFKFMQAFYQRHSKKIDPYDYLDLVAVSIAADLVPINGENRILAYHGLKKLNTHPCLGLKALMNSVSFTKNKDVTITDIVFGIAPIINASGRIGHAQEAVSLLTTKDDKEVATLTKEMHIKNEYRKAIDLETTNEALAMIQENNAENKSTCLHHKKWHKGIIGIVASRCIEKHYRPTIILTNSDGKIIGSGRSIKGFNLYNALSSCSHLLEKFGGHKYAAGIMLKEENLSSFKETFEQIASASLTEEMLTPVIDIDEIIPLNVITKKFWVILNQMEPFGPQNPKPVFEAKNIFVIPSTLRLVKEKHVRFMVGQKGNNTKIQAIGFNMASYYSCLIQHSYFNAVFTIENNTFKENSSLQLRIKDMKFDSHDT